MSAQVYYSANKSVNWTKVRITASGMANNFVSYAILLVCKSESSEGGLLYLCRGGSDKIQSMGRSNEELDILK
jgi:hypothetical protein